MTPRMWLEAARFLWRAGRGHRLRPWRSAYVRWRIETYSGQDADSVGAADFWRFLWRERRGLARYLRWTGAMRAGPAGRATPPRTPAEP